MTNTETTVEETTSRIDEFKTKVRQLPWKKIAIATAATAAVALVIANRDKLCGQQAYELEIHESTPDGELDVTMTPIND